MVGHDSPSQGPKGCSAAPGRASPAEPDSGVLFLAPTARERLLLWYERSARDLPWRRTRDPWAIWLSESLLQQTQVATALGYYERLIARYPDVLSLASGEEQELLALWSGLGYYRRARSLQAAARVVVERHAGRVPADREALLALPGIGPYTAGALLSIAFGQGEPLVDGNVARVFARLFALEQPLGQAALERRLWDLARAHLPAPGHGPRGPGAWNQALMELGATLCTPARPNCGGCPLERDCLARAAGRERELPRPKTRPETLDVELELLVVRGPRGLLLERRGESGRMAGLWELPTREVVAEGFEDAPGLLWPIAFAHSRLQLALPPQEFGVLRHAITRHRIRARLLAGRLCGHGPLPPQLAWWSEQGLTGAPLAGLARKALRAIGSWSRGTGAAARRPSERH